MNNHRKSQEATSERPAEADPSPSSDGTENSQDGAKEPRTEQTKEEA